MITKKEKLAAKLNRSISNIQEVLTHAKKNSLGIKDACSTLGKGKNYVNCGMFFLRAAEKRNKISVPEIENLENDINFLKGVKNNSSSTGSGTSSSVSATRGTQIENTLAGMKHAVNNLVSMKEAGVAVGKSEGYLAVAVSTLGSMSASRTERNEVSQLHGDYLKLVQEGTIKTGKKSSKRAAPSKKKTKSIVVSEAPVKRKYKKRRKAYKRRALNPLSHIVDQQVEFKYKLNTKRPISKVVVTYPLSVMEPGHSFAVPAKKADMRSAIKAVKKFSRKNPKAKFLQLTEGREFVTWRTK